MSNSEDIPKEFTRPEMVRILKFALRAKADTAVELGAEYIIEKYEQQKREQAAKKEARKAEGE